MQNVLIVIAFHKVIDIVRETATDQASVAYNKGFKDVVVLMKKAREYEWHNMIKVSTPYREVHFSF